ncbi:MAG: hypothetical protein ACOYN6_00120 [Ignavibacteria bacterium]
MNNNTIISSFLAQIKGLKPLKQEVIYNPKKWNSLENNFKLLIKKHENVSVSRSGIIKSYEEYYLSKANYLKPFLLTMIWGFGNIGYGNHRTNNFLNDKYNLNLIKTSLDAVKDNKVEKAFNELMRIKGLGISYVSKVLYFASKGARLKEHCLIFDIRVAESLVKLSTLNSIFEIIKVYPSNKFRDYEKYNQLIHQLAKAYSLDADAIELFLFNQEFD